MVCVMVELSILLIDFILIVQWALPIILHQQQLLTLFFSNDTCEKKMKTVVLCVYRFFGMCILYPLDYFPKNHLRERE
ncbi:hypothetical protein BDB00DRAFT_824851 [Zychaea mexicana]|uniref:uncharacterized protein n=1 Tax=Zychaea mexicana TaxID=64656 RepID=UPI0022FE73F9|nr:uncharacterized protein BDB00DRAFT_824851 [Zychaea mexicana]KAI9493004.1 hypothetical protein BDB00DRAFT_824851 [Zychaea mexicana]